MLCLCHRNVGEATASGQPAPTPTGVRTDPLASFTPADARMAERLMKWLPERLFDFHVHTCVPALMGPPPADMYDYPARLAWADALSIDDYRAIAGIMLPGLRWDALFFGMPFPFGDIEAINADLEAEADAHAAARLFVCRPDTPVAVLEQQLSSPTFRGLKPYAELVDPEPARKMRIADMLPAAHLEFAHENRLVVMLHLPGEWNVVDRDHVAELGEITLRYPGARIVLAHCALASCPDVARDYMAALAGLNLYFDTSGTTQADVFRAMLRHFGPERILFGTDHPVGLVKGRVVCDGGVRGWDMVQGNPFVPARAGSDATGRPSYALFEMLASLGAALAEPDFSSEARDLVLFGNADRLLDTNQR